MPKMSKKMIDENVIEVMKQVRHNKKIVERIIQRMEEYEYLAGNIQGYIANTEKDVDALDPRTICLLLECTFEVTNINKAYPKHYFTEPEIKTSKQFTGDMIRKDRKELPLAIYDVSEIGDDMYITKMTASEINDWLNSLLLNYNFDTQREPTIEMFQGQIIFEPTVYPQNIKEMTELIVTRKFIPANAIIINAGIRTADSGDGEFIFNRENKTLTIAKGTKLDVNDGYHRCRAIQNAMSINKTTGDLVFPVIFTNFTIKKSNSLLEQMSKATPILPTRIKEFKDDDLGNDVVQRLKGESELKGKIITSGIRTYDDRYLVAHDILADIIRDTFKMKNKADAMDVGDYLTDFFDYLIGSHEKEFINNVTETRKKSFINHDFMFVGYIVLAKRMMDEGIKYREIRSIMSSINFNKENTQWKKLKIVNKNGETVAYDKAKKIIAKYFKEIELKEGVSSE